MLPDKQKPMPTGTLQVYKKHDVLGYYKLLQLSPNATPAEIRKNYYALALVYHPDKNDSTDAEVMFKAIVQAYDILRDPEKRKLYDSLTYSCTPLQDGTGTQRDVAETDVTSFLFGTLLGNVFIYGASAGIIVCPLWGWILAPTLLFVIIAPTLHAKKYTKLSALCCGVAIAPITAVELGVRVSLSVLSGVAGYLANALPAKRQLEDIEDGWVEVEVE